MITRSELVRPRDILADGSTVVSRTDHGDYVALVVHHPIGGHRIRPFDKGISVTVTRPRITFGPIGGNPILEDDRANRASDAYESRLGL